jgi:type IV secretory pathway TraG/TraD family ATPase VirD4
VGLHDPALVLGALASAGGRLLLAVPLGLLAARVMRRRGVHWGWPALAAPGAVLLHPALGAMTVPVGLAALLAARRLRRWHRKDIWAGGDLARGAGGLQSPLAAGLRRVRRASELSGAWRGERPGELVLGACDQGKPVSIPFGDRAGRHTLVVGATGSGKTVTQTLMAVSAIERGLAAIVVDPKGDPGMRSGLQAAAAAAGREFLEWTPSGPCTYNPYARGSETEIADRLLAGERFTEPHYMRQAQRYLGHVVRALRNAGAEVALGSIVDHLDPDRLELLLRELAETEAEASHRYLDSLTPRQTRDLAGVRDRLAILTESDVGAWLDPSTSPGRAIDLIAAARAGSVVYFSLESDSRPLLAQMLGAAVVQDLQSTIAALQGEPAPALVLIDEFSAVAAEHVVALFGRARSAGFSLLLGTQELSDLRLPGHERLLEQVLGNLSALIAHRQVVPRSAELISGMGGLGGVWRVSFSSDGRTTRTRVAAPLLEPEDLMRLEPGRCAVLALGSGGGARIVRIAPAGGGR